MKQIYKAEYVQAVLKEKKSDLNIGDKAESGN